MNDIDKNRLLQELISIKKRTLFPIAAIIITLIFLISSNNSTNYVIIWFYTLLTNTFNTCFNLKSTLNKNNTNNLLKITSTRKLQQLYIMIRNLLCILFIVPAVFSVTKLLDSANFHHYFYLGLFLILIILNITFYIRINVIITKEFVE